MSDEIKAALLSLAYIIGLLIGSSCENKQTGAVIIIFSTLLFVGILYASWCNDQKDKRLKRYVDHADDEIREATNRERN